MMYFIQFIIGLCVFIVMCEAYYEIVIKNKEKK